VEMLGDWSPLPVTYAGGARTLADLEQVKALGKGRVDLTIGSALDIFGGEVSYRQVVAWQRRQEQEDREREKRHEGTR
jgi:phosphoribosylformimino-5-aminoimidazole carboxamide ribotide isomerase